jgi:hypothetical protein
MLCHISAELKLVFVTHSLIVSQSASIRLVFSFVCAQNTVKVDNIDNIYIHTHIFKKYCTINVSYKLCKVIWKTERTLVIMDCSV